MKDVRTTIAALSSWQIVHTHQETNFAAHGLAKATIKRDIDIWLEEIPSCICDLVLLELAALGYWSIESKPIIFQKLHNINRYEMSV